MVFSNSMQAPSLARCYVQGDHPGCTVWSSRGYLRVKPLEPTHKSRKCLLGYPGREMYGNHRIYFALSAGFSFVLFLGGNNPNTKSSVLCEYVSASGHREWQGYSQPEAVTIGYQLDSHFLGSDWTKWRPARGRRRHGRDRRMRSRANDRTGEKPSDIAT